MSSITLPHGKDVLMKDHTKLALYLLVPSIFLWALIFLFMVDNTLAGYVFSHINLTMMDMFFLVAGFIFPGAALVVGISGLSKKKDTLTNLVITLVSVVMLVLMVMNIFMF